MPVSEADIYWAIDALFAVDGVAMDPEKTVEDVVGLAAAYPDADEFAWAVSSTVRMLGRIVAGKVDTSALADDYEGWRSCHYQHRPGQGVKARLRIMYAEVGGVVRVRGFGERGMPADFYRRMAEAGRPGLQGGGEAAGPAAV